MLALIVPGTSWRNLRGDPAIPAASQCFTRPSSIYVLDVLGIRDKYLPCRIIIHRLSTSFYARPVLPPLLIFPADFSAGYRTVTVHLVINYLDFNRALFMNLVSAGWSLLFFLFFLIPSCFTFIMKHSGVVKRSNCLRNFCEQF